MDVDALIKSHSEELDEEVNDNAGLEYRVLARARAKSRMWRSDWLKIGRYALVYSLLFLFALFVHFRIIGLVKNTNGSAAAEYDAETDSFQADFSGSISQAYREVIQWED